MDACPWEEMLGTQLVAGACNKEHRSKVLAESATLKSLEEKLERLSTLEKSESLSATLSGQSRLVTDVRGTDTPEVPRKCGKCQEIHKKCGKCERRHPCSLVCYNCYQKGHVKG